MSASDWLILVLATWRVSHLFVHEAGFLDLAERTRRLANYWRVTSELFSCVWCLSIWVGALFVLIWWYGGVVVLAPFALSAGAILIEIFLPD